MSHDINTGGAFMDFSVWDDNGICKETSSSPHWDLWEKVKQEE